MSDSKHVSDIGNLVDLSIGELMEDGRVDISGNDDYEKQQHANNLKSIGNRLRFSVDEERMFYLEQTEDGEIKHTLPFRLRLVTDSGYLLVPNSPVEGLKYIQTVNQEGTNIELPRFEGSSIIFPENHAEVGLDKRQGYGFANLGFNPLNGDAYFKKSGWDKAIQPRPSTWILIDHGNRAPKRLEMKVSYSTTSLQ
ncbi:hypothetical protein ISS07_06600 [Candidatus Woesearchaeota archaeon]|nr:hypothetical protein [Candidatus Woesearchaeota archaeon]